MNKMTVLAKNKQTYFIQRLTEEVGAERIDLFDPWSDSWDTPVAGPVLCRTTGVYHSDRDLHYIREKARNERIINPLEALELCRSKKSQYSFFDRDGLPQLPWLDLSETSVACMKEFLRTHVPGRCLIKPHKGQGGWGVRALTTEELLDWFGKSEDREYLLQPYIEGARELRYFFINDWGLTLERVQRDGEVAANFRAQGTAKVIPTPAHFKNLISKYDFDYGAMDVLMVEGSPRILEINMVPGIEQLEEVSGENVMKRLACAFKFN